MNLEIRTKGLELTASLREFVEKRMADALGHHLDQIRWVRVQFADINGPRGGVDIRCTIRATVQLGGDVVVHETMESPGSALSKAADSLRTSVSRRISRLKTRRRRMPPFVDGMAG
ncbi:MAG: ribosome-associated translation inhibitor RaiA [Planctomycetes bacterium]|nr:ribosome-associated translation inhibitor RaiA [Planctomycetota bacterium]MCB9910937.1 ribosome-associated translation inhibitor RaiA [Planctomycetota bacterium]MCB9911596.1 ribosome-associated translation inhibitor RaiA [Planctomycetota bacterium]HPF13069.1 HPF/RaiA family ribosome-associated protein [Planctomycetota bacterium]HRV81711.1 HPF/RaiA family ribosome-associated protein [Planctomycetota bacterium]